MNNQFADYQGLCRSLVKRFLRGGLERDDLEQVAALGLVKALRRYSADRGVPFLPYAWSCICGELLHYVRDHERIVRMPRAVWELAPAVRDCAERLQHRKGAMARAAEIAAEIDAPAAAVELLQAGGIQHAGLNETDAAISHNFEDRWIIRDALHCLPAPERAMIVGVYVLGFSQTEIGEKLGYAQRRASRLHARALRRFAALVGDIYA